VWVAKLSSFKVVVGCDAKNIVCYKVCTEVDGTEKLMVPKFDHL
jgi:hypothetical protein